MTINPLRTREAVVVPDRPKLSKAQKVAIWNRCNGICWWCGKPVAALGLSVAYDHKRPRELSADDDPSNLYPMHAERCHERKTLDEDRPRITKAHRQEKLTRPKERKRTGFKGWRNMRGEVVWASEKRSRKAPSE